ncbi:E3 ubiquitin-protein ligase [Canna indica]|uniref:E3 ubiquitin-protein ligase RMA n=1 Tax=Canna indica TaxID=4628 RepID=A0AAQ3KND9_9LILI|nr:E3 ubiquitin-protein ligase [Canna indica]
MDVHRGAEGAVEQRKKGELDVGASPATANGCFDCNICFDFAVDPVVTLCGHLYCWPCIYKWLQQAEGAAPQPCPVCKAILSEDSLVPLYGRGGHASEKSPQSLEIPRRPSPAHRDLIEHHEADQHPEVHLRYRHQQQQHHYDQSTGWDYTSPPVSPLGETRVIHSTAGGVLGGVAVAVLPWVFRNQEWGRLIQYSSPYYMGGNGSSPRLRRQEMELERSLHQIWVFLFCCALLCLVLF